MLKPASLSRDAPVVHLPRGKLPKTQQVGPLEPISLSRNDERPNICPVHLVYDYIDKSSEIRGSEVALFITTTRPHKQIAQGTARRWLLDSLS